MIVKKNICIAIATLCCLSSCVMTSAPPEAGGEKQTVRHIALLPVRPALVADGRHEAQDRQLKEGTTIFEQTLADYFAANPKMNIIPAAKAEILATDVSVGGVALARHIGKKLGADATMIFTLYRFSERQGSDYGANRPASVSFDYRLVHNASGQILCSGMFDETQQSFLQNIFSFPLEKGIRWMTGEEFARHGLEKRLKNCEYLKEDSL